MRLPLNDMIPDVRTASISSLEGMNQSVHPSRKLDLVWASWYHIVPDVVAALVAITVLVLVLPAPIAVPVALVVSLSFQYRLVCSVVLHT